MKGYRGSKREIKAKKSNPRVYLNIHGNLVFLSFVAHSKVLTDKEYQTAKKQKSRPKKICIRIGYTDVKTLLFSEETDITIHEDIAKYLMARKNFRNELSSKINYYANTIINYTRKAKSCDDRDGKVEWYRLILAEQVKLNSLIGTRDILLSLIS